MQTPLQGLDTRFVMDLKACCRKINGRRWLVLLSAPLLLQDVYCRKHRVSSMVAVE